MKIPKELYNGIIIWIELYLFPNNEGFKPCGFILSQSAEYSLFTMAQTEC
jgi:hypothetical protein